MPHTKNRPGTINPIAYNILAKLAAPVVIGRAVVVIVIVDVDPLVPCMVTLGGLKVHDEFAGCPEHERLMLDVYKGVGVSTTW
jgi:hypothetical protein